MKTDLIIPETRGRKDIYGFYRMDIGESKVFSDTSIVRISAALRSFVKRRKLDWRFTSRTIDKGVVCVWRVK